MTDTPFNRLHASLERHVICECGGVQTWTMKLELGPEATMRPLCRYCPAFGPPASRGWNSTSDETCTQSLNSVRLKTTDAFEAVTVGWFPPRSIKRLSACMHVVSKFPLTVAPLASLTVPCGACTVCQQYTGVPAHTTQGERQHLGIWSSVTHVHSIST